MSVKDRNGVRSAGGTSPFGLYRSGTECRTAVSPPNTRPRPEQPPQCHIGRLVR
jgi:hypothetical protein